MNLSDSLNSFIDIRSLDSIASAYENIAHDFYENGNYDSAYVYYLKQLNTVRKNYSSTDIELGNLYINLGVMNFGRWRFEEALEYYSKAEEIFKGIENDYIDLGSIYVNQGIIFRLLGDFDQAELHCNNAIRIFSRQAKLNYKYLNIAYYNLALINRYSENYEEAIIGFTKSINYNHEKDTLIQINSLTGIALCYEKLNNTSMAQRYHLSTIDLSKSFYGENNPKIADPLMNYGLFYVEKLGRLEEGKDLIEASLKMFLEQYGNKSDEVSICYYNLAEYSYLHQGDIEKSLVLLQKSLIAAEPNFNDSSIYANPEINTDRLNTRLLVTINLKGRILLDLYYKTNSIKNLVNSLETYELALQNIDKMRVRYGNENSRLLISEQQNRTFQEAIFVANLLYQLTENSDFLQKSLEFNERAKAFSLLISIRRLNARQFGGIPLNLLEKEKDYSRQLSLFEELIFEEKRKSLPDQISIEAWEEKLFWLKQENQRLLQDFEDSFPEYYRLKYDTEVISLDDIKNKLGSGEALIEYTLIDTLLFIYSFTNNSGQLYRIPIDSSFHNHLNLVRENLSIPRFSSNVNENYKKFCVSSHQLYRILIEPCKEMIKGKAIIIIPDGQLSYIPFEALLTHPLFSESVDYRHLPYLIREHPVSYAYSATLHFDANKRRSVPEKGLLAFAPKYSALLAQNGVPEPSDFLEQYREQLVPIPGVKEEVKMISRIVEGDIWMDEEATETRFKQDAEKYDILHLAMHTIVNNEDPMYSKLAFVQNIDSLNDGFLNTYEIYNMRFNARMAVLSSCKTGFGKLMKGEGVMSLARGFMYAGCPSIIMTLWEVSDKSGARLMQDFYKTLIKGETKAKALQRAKLDFLKTADKLKANPYFWSTYVIIGDASPMYEKNRRYLYWIGALALLAGVVLGVVIRNGRKNSMRTNGLQPDNMYS